MSDFNSVNRVFLVGYVTKGTPKASNLQRKDISRCAFNVATNERFTKDGETKSKAYYHLVVAWGKTAEFCQNWLQKGTLVAIIGRLRPRVWNSPDGKRKLVEVHIDQINLLGKRQDIEETQEEEPEEENQEEKSKEDPF